MRVFRIITFATAMFTTGIAAAQVACPGPAELLFKVGKYSMDLQDKKPICVTLPGTFTIKIINPPGSGVSIDSGDVTVKQKDGVGLTIDGSNTATTNKLVVTVEGTADVGDEFDFLIKVDGIGVLDPKVRVVGSNTMFLLQSRVVYETLDYFGLSMDDAMKLEPPPSGE